MATAFWKALVLYFLFSVDVLCVDNIRQRLGNHQSWPLECHALKLYGQAVQQGLLLGVIVAMLEGDSVMRAA